ncbi:MAG: ZIP family metal transporter [Culicoidibacterales bacterium]
MMEMSLEWFKTLPPVTQAFAGGMLGFIVTTLGASIILVVKNVNQKLIDGMLGFSAGIMIAASFWSLLNPAIDQVMEGYGKSGFWMIAVGFLLGGGVLWALDKIIPHLHMYANKSEGVHTKWSKSTLLMLAITMHNIPEGLSVGVAFGGAALTGDPSLVTGAIGLAIGIAIQNFPEGTAISAPMYADGISKTKAVIMGSLSAIVEPVAAVIGALLVLQMQAILPFALAFAAGAMIFVVVEELIPESQANENTDFATLMAMVGFTIMMTLDVILG